MPGGSSPSCATRKAAWLAASGAESAASVRGWCGSSPVLAGYTCTLSQPSQSTLGRRLAGHLEEDRGTRPARWLTEKREPVNQTPPSPESSAPIIFIFLCSRLSRDGGVRPTVGSNSRTKAKDVRDGLRSPSHAKFIRETITLPSFYLLSTFFLHSFSVKFGKTIWKKQKVVAFT